jgi:hypothetical protein
MFDKIKKIIVLLAVVFSANNLFGYDLIVINDCKIKTISFKCGGSPYKLEPGQVKYITTVDKKSTLKYKRLPSPKELEVVRKIGKGKISINIGKLKGVTKGNQKPDFLVIRFYDDGYYVSANFGTQFSCSDKRECLIHTPGFSGEYGGFFGELVKDLHNIELDFKSIETGKYEEGAITALRASIRKFNDKHRKRLFGDVHFSTYIKKLGELEKKK